MSRHASASNFASHGPGLTFAPDRDSCADCVAPPPLPWMNGSVVPVPSPEMSLHFFWEQPLQMKGSFPKPSASRQDTAGLAP